MTTKLKENKKPKLTKEQREYAIKEYGDRILDIKDQLNLAEKRIPLIKKEVELKQRYPKRLNPNFEYETTQEYIQFTNEWLELGLKEALGQLQTQKIAPLKKQLEIYSEELKKLIGEGE